MRLAQSESGQTTVTALLFLTVLLGVAALVVDLGVWLTERSKLQSAVDSAALAAAQGLGDTSLGARLGNDYASRNDLSSPEISFSGGLAADDTVTVRATRTLDGFFSVFFGKPSVEAHVEATAHVVSLGAVRNVVPIAVGSDLPALVCGEPCFGQATTIPLDKRAPGAAYLVSLGKKDPKPEEKAKQLGRGYPISMTPGKYKAEEGRKLRDKKFSNALRTRLGKELILPVYSQGEKGDKIDVTTWVSFTLTGYSVRGRRPYLAGYFQRLIESGEDCQTDAGAPTKKKKKKQKKKSLPGCSSTTPLLADPSFGAISISLTN